MYFYKPKGEKRSFFQLSLDRRERRYFEIGFLTGKYLITPYRLDPNCKYDGARIRAFLETRDEEKIDTDNPDVLNALLEFIKCESGRLNHEDAYLIGFIEWLCDEVRSMSALRRL